MRNNLMSLVSVLAVIAIVVCIVLVIIALIEGLRITDGCLFRYNFTDDGSISYADSLEATNVLRASGNYTGMQSTNPDGTPKIVLDPAHYGEWLETSIDAYNGQEIKLKITGEISLCRAYVPKNNLQSTSDLDKSGERIPIPRANEVGSEPLSLIFSATTNEWRNITEIFQKDDLIVSISKHKLPTLDKTGNVVQDVSNVSMYDVFTKTTLTADCTEGQRAYSPICGRYSVYSGQYATKCKWDECAQKVVQRKCAKGICGHASSFWVDGEHGDCEGWTACSNTREECRPDCTSITSTAPEPYKYNGTYTFPWSSNISSLLNVVVNCNSDDEGRCNGTQIPKYKFWYTADTATGLLQRLDNTESVTNPQDRGSAYNFAKISDDQNFYNSMPVQKSQYIVLNTASVDQVQYLQYRFLDLNNDFSHNTGGYVLNIKQTKCRRINGEFFTDTFENRGKVLYVIAPSGQNPNNDLSGLIQTEIIPTKISGDSSITPDTSGRLWLKISNKPEDYKDSIGQYNVQSFTSKPTGQFSSSILTPLFDNLKGKVMEMSKTIFKNMTCYNGGGAQYSSCINFFNLIKGMLILYIMVYGAMFLLGMTQITQTDLVIRVVKIAIVAGLLNGKTFNFFNEYVFNFVMNFSDSIIADMSGYSLFTNDNNISNPFMFLDSLLSKVLFSQTFFAQIVGLIALGITGVLYFILIFVGLVVTVITLLRAIAIYIMAFMGIAVLIGLTPLFLTFLLFDYTRYLFDNWVKFLIQFMLEPVVLMAGIIILSQLFTIYVDFVLGYSVCWKCVMPFKIPFPNIPLFPSAYANRDLFCIYWFAPWGFDNYSGMMGLNMQHIVALVIISYCMWGYAELSGKMVSKLVGTMGISATSAGQSMASAFGNKALESVGLDKQTREKIKEQAGERLKKRKGANNEGASSKASTPPSGGKTGA